MLNFVGFFTLLFCFARLEAANAGQGCSYKESPDFCSMEQHYQCRGLKDSSYDAILRIKTLGSNPYLLVNSGEALGLLRFEYQLWAAFDNGTELYLSDNHQKTGKIYENGEAQTIGPNVKYRLWNSEYGPIPRVNDDSSVIEEGLLMRFEQYSKAETDHHFLLHAIPEKNVFNMYWYAYTKSDGPNDLDGVSVRIEKSICRPVQVKMQ